jgi:hydroxymethylpyrimidine pyrophosphatase-like HAD family hydrolase
VPLCLVSARSPEGLCPIQRALGFTGPLACFSGAYVLDHEGNELYSSVIPTADALAIKRWIGENLPDVLCASYGFHDWIVDDRSDPLVAREEAAVQTCARECSDIEGTFGERGVHKLLIMGERDSILEAERVLSARYPHLNVVRASPILCEVMVRGVSKSEAVRVIGEGYVHPAYDYVLKCSHTFNLLDARGAISVSQRAAFIGRVRKLARLCAECYLAQREKLGYPMLHKGEKA